MSDSKTTIQVHDKTHQQRLLKGDATPVEQCCDKTHPHEGNCTVSPKDYERLKADGHDLSKVYMGPYTAKDIDPFPTQEEWAARERSSKVWKPNVCPKCAGEIWYDGNGLLRCMKHAACGWTYTEESPPAESTRKANERRAHAQETESGNEGPEASSQVENSPEGAGPDRRDSGNSGEHGGLEELHEERGVEVPGDRANHPVNAVTQTDNHPSDEGGWTKSMSHFASEKNYWKARAQHYEALYQNKSNQLIRFVNREKESPTDNDAEIRKLRGQLDGTVSGLKLAAAEKETLEQRVKLLEGALIKYPEELHRISESVRRMGFGETAPSDFEKSYSEMQDKLLAKAPKNKKGNDDGRAIDSSHSVRAARTYPPAEARAAADRFFNSCEAQTMLSNRAYEALAKTAFCTGWDAALKAPADGDK